MEENKNPIQILALRPGKREMGIAMLEEKDLVDWEVTGFRESDTGILLDKIETRLVSLIQRYQPTVLAIEQPSTARLKASSLFLGLITGRISIIAVEAGLRFLAYDALEIRKRLCGSASATRSQLAEQIVEHYPDLKCHLRCSSKWQENYWMPMFAAVAVGLVCVQDLSSLSSIPRGAECATSVTLNQEAERSSP